MKKLALLLSLLFAFLVQNVAAQVTTVPIVMPRKQFLDQNGDPLSGGKVYTYTVGTTTPQTTYTDYTGMTPNANPIILDAAGRAAIYINCAQSPFKIVVKDENDVTQWTEDGVQYPTCIQLPQSCPVGEVMTGFNSAGTITCATVGGAVPIGSILNTTTNRWASWVASCTSPIAAEVSEGVFADWYVPSITSRVCNDGTYEFPYVIHTTSGSASSYHVFSTDDESWVLSAEPEFSIRTSISDRATGARRWIGWTDTTELGMVSTDTPTNANIISFWSCPFNTIIGCNPDGGGNIWAVVEDGVTANITREDTGVAFVPDQIYLFQISWDEATNTATFKIDGVTVATMATNTPANTAVMRVNSSITNTSGTQTYSMRHYGAFLYNALSVP